MSRKFRWSFEADFPECKIKPEFVRLAVRPVVNEDFKFPLEDCNKGIPVVIDKSGEIVTTYFDTTDDQFKTFASLKSLGTGKLVLLIPGPDKCWCCGLPKLFSISGPLESLEEWTLEGLSLEKFNRGELNYTGEDIITIEATWKYERFIYRYCKPLLEAVAKSQGPPAEPPAKPPTVGNGGLSLGTLGCHCRCGCPKPETDSKPPQG